jgi:dihydropteroate synthase
MTLATRPRLLGSWEAATAELSAFGFEETYAPPGCQVVLWEDLPADVLSMVQDDHEACLRKSVAGRSVLLSGPHAEFEVLARNLTLVAFERASDLLSEVVNAPFGCRKVRFGTEEIAFDRTRIVGIVNMTPDSFYDGGRYDSLDGALARAARLEKDGADFIEVGGEKAGPGAAVSESEELDRVIPVLEGIRRRSDIRLSIDTRKPGVALRALMAGAQIVNDINGMRDPAMRRVVAETGAAAVVMHIKGSPRVAQPNPEYGSVVADIGRFLHDRIEDCKSEGIDPSKLIIDPGPGFGKSTLHDVSLLRHLHELRGFPQVLMLSVSRKSFLGEILNAPPEDRLEGSLAVTAFAMTIGVEFVRTHDVRATRRVVDVMDTLKAGGAGP